MNNIPLLWSYELNYDLQPPVKTRGYKYFAPTERDDEALMSEMERARFPDLSLGRSTFKRAIRRGGRIWEPSRENYCEDMLSTERCDSFAPKGVTAAQDTIETMLNKISVKNFRSIKSAELELAPITVLYGPIASGKSSLLYAPMVLRNFVTNPGRSVDAFFDLGFINLGGFEACIFDHSINKSVEISLSGEINGERLSFGVSFSKDSAEITAELGDFQMRGKVPLPYALNQSFPFPFVENKEEFTVTWNGLGSIVIPQVETDLSLQKAQSIAARLNQTSELLNSLDIAPHRRGFFKPQYVSATLSPLPTSEDEVASIIINNQYLAAKISRYSEEICDRDFRTYTVPGTQVVKFQTTDKEGKIPVDIVNDGFGINQIMYLWAKLLRNEVRTELIEEPESHLHPSIIRRFARTLSKLVEEQENEKQVVLATHSEQFVAALLAAVSDKILPSEHIRCYLSDKSGSATTFEAQQVNDDGQIEGGLVAFVESQMEDIKSLFGIS